MRLAMHRVVHMQNHPGGRCSEVGGSAQVVGPCARNGTFVADCFSGADLDMMRQAPSIQYHREPSSSSLWPCESLEYEWQAQRCCGKAMRGLELRRRGASSPATCASLNSSFLLRWTRKQAIELSFYCGRYGLECHWQVTFLTQYMQDTSRSRHTEKADFS